MRLHDTTLYVSTYGFDDDLLVNQHIWGSPPEPTRYSTCVTIHPTNQLRIDHALDETRTETWLS